jgi:AcrR family transcriptional regulator
MTEKETKRRPSSQARRKELVQIAYRLIAEKGLEGLRTRDVAEAAGIDTGTLHYHFPSKEALEQAVVEHLSEDFSANRIAAGKAPANALEELRNEIFDVALRVRQTPDQLLVMMDLTVRASRDPVVAEILRRMSEGWTWSISRMLKSGIEQGLFRADLDPEAVAPLLRAQLTGLGTLGLAQPERVEAAAAGLYSQLQTWLSKATK